MKLTQNKLSVILATVMAGAAIIANTVSAKAAEPVKTGLNGRYILEGIVTDVYTFDEVPGKVWRTIVDQNGEEWVYTYEITEKCMPNVGQKVVMVMDSNGTVDDITDDSIEDLFFQCNCCDITD